MIGKWLQLLKEVAPGVTRVAVIFNPDTAAFRPLFDREIEAARSFGVTVTLAPVHDDAGIEEAIAAQASRAQPRGSRGSRYSEAAPGERQTLRWSKRDSNRWSPRKKRRRLSRPR